MRRRREREFASWPHLAPIPRRAWAVLAVRKMTQLSLSQPARNTHFSESALVPSGRGCLCLGGSYPLSKEPYCSSVGLPHCSHSPTPFLIMFYPHAQACSVIQAQGSHHFLCWRSRFWLLSSFMLYPKSLPQAPLRELHPSDFSGSLTNTEQTDRGDLTSSSAIVEPTSQHLNLPSVPLEINSSQSLCSVSYLLEKGRCPQGPD